MKPEKSMSLKWNVFFQFIVFAAVVLVCLWIFQIVFLDSFYKQIKIHEIRKASETIEHNIDSEQLSELAVSIAREGNMCMAVYDASLNEVMSIDILPDCVIHKLPDYVIGEIYEKTGAGGGEHMEIFSREAFFDRSDMEDDDDDDFPQVIPRREGGMGASLIYARIVKDGSGGEYLVLLNSTISPVNATVNTLRTQLLIITAIMILLAFVLALIISKRIAKPIVKINESAKQLAQGDYDADFSVNGGEYREITELSNTLDHASRELSKVESLRRELIANVSHDLRTPLTLITGYGEMMRDIPGENTAENIQIIIDEASHLTELVNDVLDISRLQSGEQVFNIERFSLTEMIEEILTRYNRLVSRDGYTIDFERSENVFIDADETRMAQVIYNLMNNAVNYTGEDRRVRISQKVRGDRVRVEVTDTGAGIAEKDLPYIWDRYYKVDKTHKRGHIGTGLGLSIVKHIFEQHKARYGVESELGKGSTFWFELEAKGIKKI
ncbi:MAG: two-component sensor histidine kinase [Clostridia bacterium]|nr:two-component sensor histidine kinase [Clostridia bacterium]